MANRFKIGDRVVRGDDWTWGKQDCDDFGKPTIGTVTGFSGISWTKVTWDNGRSHNYPNDELKSYSNNTKLTFTPSEPTKTIKKGGGEKEELLMFFKIKKMEKCPICGGIGQDLFFKFCCSNRSCQNFKK